MAKHVFLRTIVVVITFFILSCSIKNQREEVLLTDLFYGYGFTVKTIPTVIVKSNISVEIDFHLYSFSKNEVELLAAYAGERPKFHKRQGEKNQYTLNNGAQITCFEQNQQNKYSTECLVKLNHKEFPSYVHFWYTGLQEKDKSLADAIINSIETHKMQ